MKKYEKILKAMANMNRLKILVHLKKQADVGVGDMADVCNIAYKSASKHLSILYQADIVDRSRMHNETYYRISDTIHPVAKSVISNLSK